MRKSGIEVIGDVPWSTHFCQFYQTKQDLIDTLIPYFRNGLESNEFCMWVTADNLNKCEAEQALREAIHGYDQYVERGAMIVLPYTEWYLDDGEFDRHKVLDSWIEKLDRALSMGFDGARVTGDTMWLNKSHWHDFTEYEESINTVIGDQPLLVLCTYSLDKCGAGEIADVVANHEFALMKRSGEWTLIESSPVKHTKQALQNALDKLEIRSRELELLNEQMSAANEELRTSEEDLRSEIEERKLAEEKVQRKNAILDGINRIFRGAMTCETEEELGRICLIVAEEITESKCGFIGEINSNGRMDDIAISDPGWAACKMSNRTGHRTVPTGFEVHGIYGRVLQDGEGFFTNDPPSHPDSIGVPTCHPPLTAFLGMPLLHSGDVIGMIGLANRNGGYGAEEMEAVEALSVAIVQAFMRFKAEQNLSRAYADAERREAQLQSFVYSMPDGVVLFDAEQKVLSVNEATGRLFGAPADIPFEEWIRQYEIHSLDNELMSFDKWPSTRALKGEETKGARFKVVTPWKEFIASISGGPVRDAHSRVVGGTLSIRDITDAVDYELKKEELYEREHHIAEVLQKALVPDACYDIPGCQIAVRYEAALKEAEVGGDFYDVFDLGDNKIGLLIGDVAGKGLTAAIQVAAARHSVRSYAYIDPRPGKVMGLVNNALCRDPDEGIALLTAFFAVVDLEIGVMTYANGGHEMPVLRHSDGTVEELVIHGRALGVREGCEYDDRSVILKHGDLVTMVTDGIVEARTNSRDLFGSHGLMSFLSTKRCSTAAELADGLLASARKHAGGVLRDDAAILIFGLGKSSNLDG